MKFYETMHIGTSRFDPLELALTNSAGELVPLRHQSSEVLRILANRPSEIVSKDEILSTVWPDTHVTDASLVQCIKDIRRALGSDREHLATVPKRGYQLKAAPAKSALSASDARRPILLVPPFSETETPGSTFGELVRTSAVSYLSRFPEIAVRSTANSEEDGHYNLKGSLHRLGNRVRLDLQLLDRLDGECLWSETIEREIDDPFETHDIIGRKIAATFGGRVAHSVPRGDRLSANSALKYCLADRALIHDSEKNLREAVDLNLKAMAVEPTSAFGHIGMGFVQLVLFRNDWCETDRQDALSLARHHAETAVSLEPLNYGSQFCLGKVHRFEGDLDAARRRLSRALELNPCSPGVRHTLGNVLLLIGEAEVSLALQEETFAMTSNKAGWPYGSMAFVLWANKRFEDAIEMQLKRLNQEPSELSALAVYQMDLGMSDAAKQSIRSLLSQMPDWTIGNDPVCTAFRDAELRRRYTDALRAAGAPE